MPGMAPPEFKLSASSASELPDSGKGNLLLTDQGTNTSKGQISQSETDGAPKDKGAQQTSAEQNMPEAEPVEASSKEQSCSSKQFLSIEKNQKDLKDHHEKPASNCSFVYSRFKSYSGLKKKKFKSMVADNSKGKVSKSFLHTEKRFAQLKDPTPGKLMEQHFVVNNNSAAQNTVGPMRYPGYGLGNNLITHRVPAGEKWLSLIEIHYVDASLSCVRWTKCKDQKGGNYYKKDPVLILGGLKYFLAAGAAKTTKFNATQKPNLPRYHQQKGENLSNVPKMKSIPQHDAAPYAFT